MLKKFLSKLFTGLYLSSLLLTVMPQTAFASATEAHFGDPMTGEPITALSAEVGQVVPVRLYVTADSITEGEQSFITPGASENATNRTPLTLQATTSSISFSVLYLNAGEYEVEWCFFEVGTPDLCVNLPISVSEPAPPAPMELILSTPIAAVEATETVPFTAEISNIPEGATTLFLNMNFDLATSDTDYPASITLAGQNSYSFDFTTHYTETGDANPSLCISTNLDPALICSALVLTVIEDIPMSVAFQDEGMSAVTGESFSLSAFVDEIPELAGEISYGILNLSGGEFLGQSGTLSLEEGETTAFLALNDLILTDLGNQELELCVQNNVDLIPVCTAIVIGVFPAPLSTTSSLDLPSIDPGASVTANFSFQSLDPESITLDVTVQWGDGSGDMLSQDIATYAGEDLSLSHLYAEEGLYSIEICGNDGREDACSTQILTVEAPLTVALTLEETGINQVAAHAVVSNLDADAINLPYTIDWGEGTVQAFSALANGVASLNLNEVFSCPTEGVYTIEICVQEAAEIACDVQTIDINLAPLTLNVNGGEAAVYTDQAQTLSLDVAGIASFAEALNLSISWGDGTVEETVATGADIATGTYSLPITHAYTAAGTYTFEVCGNDGRAEVCINSEVIVKMPLTLELTEPVIAERTISVDSRVEGINAGVSTLTYSYTWGDGTADIFDQEVAPGEIVIIGGEHTYLEEGIYEPQLCVTDGVQEACQGFTISVTLAPEVGAPGFTLTETGDNTQVSEDGDTDTFSVVLIGRPASDVVLQVTSGDAEEGTVSPATLTFTPENWDTAQIVTLTGVNDDLADATQIYFITVSINDEASPAAFAELADQTVRAVTTDNDGGRTSTGGGGGGGGGGIVRPGVNTPVADENVELSSENPFTDLSADSPYFDAVMDLYGQGIVQGYEDGTFQAENITNRAEFMKFVVVAAGVEETTLSTYGNCFPDVTTQWYASYVCYGKEKGWIQGYPDGFFRPEQTINRVEAIKMVVNVLGLELKPGFAWDGQLFADTEAGAWYMPFVETAYSLGLVNQPADKLLHPADGMSRGALADLLSRALAL